MYAVIKIAYIRFLCLYFPLQICTLMHVNRLHHGQTTDVFIVVTTDNSPYLRSVRRDCTFYLSARKWLLYLPVELVTAALTYHDGERLSVAAESSFTKLKKFSYLIYQSCNILNVAIILHPCSVWCSLLVILQQSVLAGVLQGLRYGCIGSSHHLLLFFDSPGLLGCRRLMLCTLWLQCCSGGNSSSLNCWALP